MLLLHKLCELVTVNLSLSLCRGVPAQHRYTGPAVLMQQHMSKQRKLFLWFAGIFMLLLLYATYDIASRTTFPGSKPAIQETITGKDTAGAEKDTVTHSPDSIR